MIEHPEDRNLKSVDFAEIIADSGSALGRPQKLFERLMRKRESTLIDPESMQLINPEIFLEVIQVVKDFSYKRIYYEFDPSEIQTQFPRRAEVYLAGDLTAKPSEYALTCMTEFDHRRSEYTTINFTSFQELAPNNSIYVNRPYGVLDLEYNDKSGNLVEITHRTDLNKNETFEESNIKDFSKIRVSKVRADNGFYLFLSGKNSLLIKVLKENEATDIIQVPISIDFSVLRRTLVSSGLLQDPTDTTGRFDHTWRSADIKSLVGIRWENLKAKRNDVFSYMP